MMRHTWPRLVRWLLVLAVPVLLSVIDLRIVTSHWFVRWEYGKPGFPLDPAGFSTEERTRLAEVCVDYLATGADLSLLGDLRLSSGEAAFNERELEHMADVQLVYIRMMWVGVITALVCAGGAAALLVSKATRRHVPAALTGGGLLVLGILGGVGAFMAVSWGQFFTTFHRLFFADGTWTFPYTDTLIRLFPERFWIDVAVTVVGLIALEAVLVGLGGWIWARRIGSRE